MWRTRSNVWSQQKLWIGRKYWIQRSAIKKFNSRGYISSEMLELSRLTFQITLKNIIKASAVSQYAIAFLSSLFSVNKWAALFQCWKLTRALLYSINQLWCWSHWDSNKHFHVKAKCYKLFLRQVAITTGLSFLIQYTSEENLFDNLPLKQVHEIKHNSVLIFIKITIS